MDIISLNVMKYNQDIMSVKERQLATQSEPTIQLRRVWFDVYFVQIYSIRQRYGQLQPHFHGIKVIGPGGLTGTAMGRGGGEKAGHVLSHWGTAGDLG